MPASNWKTWRGACRGVLRIGVVAGLCLWTTTAAVAEPSADVAAARNKALDFLKSSQADDGSFTTNKAPGISGLVLTAALRSGAKPEEPWVAKGLKYLEGFIQTDGGVYPEKSTHSNYETCIALLAFHEANRDGRYTKLIANADQFLRKQQWDEDEGVDKSQVNYGGAGYGSKSRPDLSNTQFLLEALKAAGAKPDDPAFQKALVFVSRTQNLESEANTTPFAAKVNDGGFYYTPSAGGDSMAGKTDNGGLRSYASMTYAGLKSMIYAGVKADDPRVKAAHAWARKHYTVDSNPGMDQQGLFYYYQTFAKALAAVGDDQITDVDGKTHNWRQDLTKKLLVTQQDNGSWINTAPRWYEGDPNLATAYALLALSYCNEPAGK